MASQHVVPQPDSLQEACKELSRLENIPGVGSQQHTIKYLQNLQVQMSDMQATVNGLQGAVDDMKTMMSRLPKLLYNSTASFDDCPLQNPHGTAVVHPMPATKRELFFLESAADCNAALAAFGLDIPPANTTIEERKQILMDYLGAAMIA